jgi:hypothetical protein
MSSTARDFLRHALATLAYRGGKVIRDVPSGFSDTKAASTSRSAGQILAHTGDLIDWALCLAKGEYTWKDSQPQLWEADVDRLHASLAKFDRYLAANESLGCSAEEIFQGPIADALTHVGQIAMLRRLAGLPVKSENYFRAAIKIGQVGADQPKPLREFD